MTEQYSFSNLEKFIKGIDKEALAELVELTGLNRVSFIQGDPMSTSYNEGGRNIGLRLLHMIDRQPMDALRDASKARISKAAKNRFKK
jgi:hypothetical protein